MAIVSIDRTDAEEYTQRYRDYFEGFAYTVDPVDICIRLERMGVRVGPSLLPRMETKDGAARERRALEDAYPKEVGRVYYEIMREFADRGFIVGWCPEDWAGSKIPCAFCKRCYLTMEERAYDEPMVVLFRNRPFEREIPVEDLIAEAGLLDEAKEIQNRFLAMRR